MLPDSVDPPLVQAFVNDTPEEEIPPEPPPTITAAQSQTVTFNDNNNQTQLFDPSLPPTIPAAESVSQPTVGDDPIPAIINLLRADNGIGMATATRWSARNFPSLDDAFSNVAYAAFNKLDAIQGKDTGSCSTDGDSSDDDSELGTIDKCIEFPPGSLFDSPRCISPTDIRDFPELQLTAPWLDNDDEDVDPSNPFEARLAELNNNVYVPIRCTARILSVGGDGSRVFKVHTALSTSSMADSGAYC